MQTIKIGEGFDYLKNSKLKKGQESKTTHGRIGRSPKEHTEIHRELMEDDKDEGTNGNNGQRVNKGSKYERI